jgi:hypothetical protein
MSVLRALAFAIYDISAVIPSTRTRIRIFNLFIDLFKHTRQRSRYVKLQSCHILCDINEWYWYSISYQFDVDIMHRIFLTSDIQRTTFRTN